MQIGVVGAGGVGGYFSSRWAEAGRDVVVLARGTHLEAIQDHGLALRSPLGEATVRLKATDQPSGLKESDVVVFATKTWQLPSAFEQVRPHLRADATLLGLQNGVESIRVFGNADSTLGVLGGTCRVISYVEKPGYIRHQGLSPTITLGEPAGGSSDRATRTAEFLNVQDRVSVTVSGDIVGDLWRKFLPFSAISGVGSYVDEPIGVVLTGPKNRALVTSAIAEAAAVGRALGVDLEGDAEERALAFLDTVPPDGTSSMYRDFKDGRRTEIEATSGYLCRTGRDFGVPTPSHAMIYEALLPLDLAVRGAFAT